MKRMEHFTKPQLAMLVLAALYILSPVDVIPELLTGPLGLVDDAGAFGVIIAILVGARSRATAPEPITVTVER